MLIKNNPLLMLLVCFILLLPFSGVLASTNSYDQAYLHPAIPLMDEDGNHVLNSGNPYSSKMSCGSSSCHDYDKITGAFHFQMGRDEASDDYGIMRGLPHLISPGYYGGYNCMGGNNPDILSKKNNASEKDFMDHGSPGLVQRCASCHMGGGWMETDREGIRYDEKDVSSINYLDGDYYTRPSSSGHHRSSDSSEIHRWDWQDSGVVEADCMICHADFNALKKFPASNVGSDSDEGADSSFDYWEALRLDMLIKKGFFREANTSIWEFYDIAPDTTDGKQLVSFNRTITEGKEGKDTGYELNLNAAGKPQMTWNADAFDTDKKVVIPMLRFPQNENCMNCHITSNSRRGFYGFGDNATMTLDEDGVVEEDYQDDVHKGKTWTADNGEVRQIENCNTCHARNYLNPSYANMDLSANHNFLKGNSDMDLRNDLDYADNAKNCEYCHDTSNNPVIPSGHDSMQSAHKELWKANGDMLGYESSTLDRITKTHLDIISCQACHITGKKSRGRSLQIMYRYRQAEDGQKKIIPYNPRIRHYWKDKNSDRVLSSAESKSVFSTKTDSEGNLYGVITDPVSGEEVAQVTASIGRHGVSYGGPSSYEDFIKLKQAYDNLLESKGFSDVNMQQIWIESNEYLMSHNVRSAAASVQCEECHAKKQSGAFSSLISPESILGAESVKTITELPDKRLVDEGYIVLGMDYFKVDAQGVVTANVDDILYSTKIDPFMSILKSSSAIASNGQFKSTTIADALKEIDINNSALQTSLRTDMASEQVFLFSNYQGDSSLKASALIASSYGSAEVLFPTYRVEMQVYKEITSEVRAMLTASLPGSIVASSIHWFKVMDKNNQTVNSFSEQLLVKITYSGTAGNITVLYSSDGNTIQQLDSDKIKAVEVATELNDGYVLLSTDSLGYFVVMSK